MISQTLLEQALKTNAPQLLMEEIQNATWLYPRPPLITREIFCDFELKLLDKALNEKPPSWWQAIWQIEPPISWRTTLNKLLINCAVRYSDNPRWLDIWNSEYQTPQEAYQLAYQCVIENNIKWLEILCRQPLLRSHPYLYNRLFKDSLRKKCVASFAFLCNHIQDRTTPHVVGEILQECVQHNFLGGVRHILNTTTKKLLKQTYKSLPDFKNLRLTKNYVENDSFVLVLTEGRLQENISKDTWIKESKNHLQSIFSLYTSDIFVYRLSPRILPPVEEVLFSHKHWEGLRMDWLVQTLNSAPSTTYLSSIGNSMREKWVNLLLPSTTAIERKNWLDTHQNLRDSPSLLALWKHPLMQETVLHFELKDTLDSKQNGSPKKI